MADSEKKSKAKPKKQYDNLDALLADIEKKFGAGTIQFGEGTYVLVEAIPTGIATLDVALGCGGIPRGRVVELFGGESSGKTTTCLQIIAACQAKGGLAAFIDAEHALDIEWARKNGVSIEKLAISQPNSGDEAMVLVDQLVDSGLFDLIVVDSVAALTPQEELDGELTDKNVGAQARLLSKSLRRLSSKCSKTKTAILFINQLRDKIGGFNPGFSKPEQTPGGRALKFYSSVRIQIKYTGAIKQGEKSIGIQSTAKIVKSKVAPPFKSAQYEIYFGHPSQKPSPIHGIDTVMSTLVGAQRLGVITLRGSNFYIGEEKIGVGKEATLSSLRDNVELRDRVAGLIQDTLKSLSVGKSSKDTSSDIEDTFDGSDEESTESGDDDFDQGDE